VERLACADKNESAVTPAPSMDEVIGNSENKVDVVLWTHHS
jgi:hypothetical protein